MYVEVVGYVVGFFFVCASVCVLLTAGVCESGGHCIGVCDVTVYSWVTVSVGEGDRNVCFVLYMNASFTGDYIWMSVDGGVFVSDCGRL